MAALDLTPAFDELLVRGDRKPTRKHTFNVANTSGFLKEAYRINTHIATLSKQLGDVRQAYLSSAPSRRHKADNDRTNKNDLFLSDAQRDDIDANAKRLLRDLNASIKGLAEAETLHQETQHILIRKKYGGGRFALLTSKSYEEATAEDAQRQAAAHHESVLWYLRQRLQACGQAQQAMMEARLARVKMESVAAAAVASASMAASTAKPSFTASSVPQQEMDTRTETETESYVQPSTEQTQLFESGNQDMVQHYESTLTKVRSAEQSLVEIAELQTMLVSNLEIQSAHVEQMVQDSFNTADNVAKGNVELKKALARPSTARYTFFVACGLSAFVVVWDFFI